MKKNVTISMFLLAILLISGCAAKTDIKPRAENLATSIPEIAPIDNTLKTYENKDLGIKFLYKFDDIAFHGKISVKDNVISYVDPNDSPSQYIVVFTKKNDQTVEEAILDAVKAKGKDPKNCIVVNNGGYWAVPGYQEYVLDLANQKIIYTKAERQKIKEAEIESAKGDSYYSGGMAEKEIYNQRLVASCSEYAEPLGLATSQTTPSRFVYNGKNKILFLPGLFDPAFYQDDSFELSD